MLPAIVRNEVGCTCLYVDGQPFPMLAGELHNSATSDLQHMQEQVWPALRGLGMNTVLAAVAWESIEPEEGVYDMSLLDGLLQQARDEHMRLVLLWFGLWKNGESYYVPEWVKTDKQRFFRAMLPSGQETATISPFCTAAVEKDKQAFVQLMSWLREHDLAHTILMVQVENELGLMGCERDHCVAAQSAWQEEIPAEAREVLQIDGCWADHPDQGEAFMAWHYAQVVETIASAGKAILPLPMYANAWLAQHPDRAGVYPSGGPVAKLIPLWQKAAPSLDMLSPDIYVKDFKTECHRYAAHGNPLFIPEAARNAGCVAKVLYAFGEHHALGFSPFGIEDLQGVALDEVSEETLKVLNIAASAFESGQTARGLAEAYRLLAGMYPLLVKGDPRGFLQGNPYESGCILSFAEYDVQLDYQEGSYGSGGIILPDQEGFWLVGCNVRFAVLPKLGSGRQVEILRYEEGCFVDGVWRHKRILNGDERYDLRLYDLPCARYVRIHTW